MKTQQGWNVKRGMRQEYADAIDKPETAQGKEPDYSSARSSKEMCDIKMAAQGKAQQGEIDAKRPWQNDSVTCVDWKSGGVTDSERIANLQFSLRNEVDAHVQVIKQRDNLGAHADKLAEAIAKIRTAMDRGLDLTPSIYGAINTLKAWEKANQ